METRKPYGLRSSKRSSLPPPTQPDTISRKRRRTESSALDIEQPQAKVARSETKSRKHAGKKMASKPVKEAEVEVQNEAVEPAKGSEDDVAGRSPHSAGEPEPEIIITQSEPAEPPNQEVTVESVLSAIPSKPLAQSKSHTPIKSVEVGLTNGSNVPASTFPDWTDLSSRLRVQNLPILENLVRLEILGTDQC